MIIIGSLALKMRAPYLLDRNPADTDYICSLDEYNDWLAKNAMTIIPMYPGNYYEKFKIGLERGIIKNAK